MIIKEYTNRIGFHKKICIDEETLIGLHDHHVCSVPFEDLDIHLNKPLSLAPDALFEKVVRERRGGFCYELNTLFCALLKQIGFECRIVSARTYQEEDVLSVPFDHMSLLVYLDDIWLVDVGYGNLFIEPIRLQENVVVEGHSKHFRINMLDDSVCLLSESIDGKNFTKRYQFETTARSVDEFQEQCLFKQQSPDSYFVKNLICTLPTETGRKTILNNQFSFKTKESKSETTIESSSMLDALLKEKFDIDLGNALNLEKLLN